MRKAIMLSGISKSGKTTLSHRLLPKAYIYNSYTKDMLYVALTLGTDIIWDQSNTTVDDRSKILGFLHSYNYDVSCSVITPPRTSEEYERWSTRLSAPESVKLNIVSAYEYPSLEEGFSSISLYSIYGVKYGCISPSPGETLKHVFT